MKLNEYFDEIDKKVKEHYAVAEEAKKIGVDPLSTVEVPTAQSLAERVTGVVSVMYPQILDPRISNRIMDLEKKYGKLDPAVGLTIAEEVAREKFCKFESHHEAMEAGVRVALAYMTLGVVSSPIEGFVELKVKKTRDGKDYFAPFYSGPIRSAGGTESAFSLVIADHLREVFGYAQYDPTPDEIKRGTHECYEYHDRVTNLQYLPSEEEIDFLMENIPIQVSGDPSDIREVYNYKDLERVETNFIRSGFALVMGEGIAQKAPKILGRIKKLQEKGFKLSGWNWMDDFVKLQKKIKEGKSAGGGGGATYIQDIVAGRPVFAHPSKSGGFRLRYGRSRNTGYSTLALNPATMAISGDFIAVGTQLKIEKPTKGCTIAACSSIDGPIVKLRDGSVKKVFTYDEGEKLYKDVEEIIYLGDILVPYGDFINRNQPLNLPGYVEEWWDLEVKEKNVDVKEIDIVKAIDISKKHDLPLHPKFIFFWTQISKDNLMGLIDWIARGSNKEKLVLPYGKNDRERFSNGKRTLEILGCEHDVTLENVVIKEKNSLLTNLGIDFNNSDIEGQVDEIIKKIPKDIDDVLEIVNIISGLKIKDKAGTFIGARMGRPEKAKLRKLTGSPHVLFPVGNEGGRLRSLLAAVDVGTVKADFPLFYCDDCKEESIFPKCDVCKKQCKKRNWCARCGIIMQENKCPEHGDTRSFNTRRVDIKNIFARAKKKVGLRIEELPAVIKGVRGTSNEEHDCEHMIKGILRAKHNLNVNKDGTIRYDMTEMPITHFKPKEVGTSVEKLIELGYEKDLNGKPLENEDQLVEIFPHDVILPACPSSDEEPSDKVFTRVAKFIDEELKILYDKEGYFNHDGKNNIIGEYFACIAPHICVAVIGRVVGFSKTQALLASPYMHAAMRRDCDGDEAAVIMLMDLLLNFSRKYLPAHRGGTQDAPLVLNTRMRAGEVDDMIFDLDVSDHIPLELYRAAEEGKHSRDIEMLQVKDRLGGKREFNDLFFSFDTDDINNAPLCSSYKTLPTMKDKVEKQMILCAKIRAADTSDVARLVIERHFLRDIRGNLRKFSMQVFRCVGCNSKFRRPPLVGKCTKCGGKIIFTISEGSIIKYMQAALDLARTFNVSPYLLECLEITQKDIDGIFGKDPEKQESLKQWF